LYASGLYIVVSGLPTPNWTDPPPMAGVEFVYADLRRWYPRSIDESRRLGLYRQRHCGCVAGKWQDWHERRARRAARRRPTA